jgi:hypothetical protein
MTRISGGFTWGIQVAFMSNSRQITRVMKYNNIIEHTQILKTMRILTATALLSIFLTSCSKDRLTASGEKTTEARTLSAFTGIDTEGSSDIHIAYGAEFKVTLSGSNNLIPYFKTEVVGSTLHLGYKNVNVRRDDVQVYVTLPEINYISVNGSGDIDLSGQFPVLDRFEVFISGSGEVEAENTLAVNDALVKISGSGEADLKRLQSNNAEVHISGSGNARISVSEKLKARISGSGEVYYLGSPQIDSQVSGSGKLVKL